MSKLYFLVAVVRVIMGGYVMSHAIKSELTYSDPNRVFKVSEIFKE